jgi:hypothetical protein
MYSPEAARSKHEVAIKPKSEQELFQNNNTSLDSNSIQTCNQNAFFIILALQIILPAFDHLKLEQLK